MEVTPPAKAFLLTEAQDSTTLRLSLSGSWRNSDDRSEAKAFLSALPQHDGVKRIVFHDGGIQEWDSTLLTFLRGLNVIGRERGVEMDLSGLPEGIRRLIHLAEAVAERKGARRSASKKSWLTRVGERTLKGFQDFGDSIRFLGELTQAFMAMLRGKAKYRKSDLFAIIQVCGPEALPIISLISLLVGMILAFLGSVQLKMFGAEIFIANGVAIGMVRVMGPLMTAIIMAGRTGAAFAAQLGTMQVNEEVDALQTMGFSPMEFLVLPRALALIIMMPLLTIYANIVGILGGAIIGILMLDLTPMQYYLQTIGALDLQSVLSGLINSSVFGVLVAISGCMQGIRCGRSASAVGEATTAAVVNAIVYIVVANAIIAVIQTITGF
ncbi:MAG TPA: ABC transporter permease [Kiritimatiellia bacterium]|nr:ABC transporter permease [Kiritimatiellia bacterium]HMO99613.1 ABC transporter permease [Kiritimatiellia bacterium]HMP96712.1 ABC transporter permease [Kiritimatiellia bacterium]